MKTSAKEWDWRRRNRHEKGGDTEEGSVLSYRYRRHRECWTL